MSDIRKAADDTPNHEWLHLLADAMEEDIAGIQRLEVNGYMCNRLRQIAAELEHTHARLDEAVLALAEAEENQFDAADYEEE